MNPFNMLPMPTSVLQKIRMDNDEISLESTGSENQPNHLEMSLGPREKYRLSD